MEREFIAERQQGLQTYLNALLAHRLLANSIHTKLFLDYEHYEENLQGLSKCIGCKFDAVISKINESCLQATKS